MPVERERVMILVITGTRTKTQSVMTDEEIIMLRFLLLVGKII